MKKESKAKPQILFFSLVSIVSALSLYGIMSEEKPALSPIKDAIQTKTGGLALALGTILLISVVFLTISLLKITKNK